MNRARFRLLVAPLFLLTAASCRDSTTGTGVDLAPAPADMSATVTDAAMATDAAPADLAAPPSDLLPPPPPTDFVVVRVGDGAAALTSAATATFLERHKISDGSIVGTPVPLPTSVVMTNKRLTISGTSQSEGMLSLSMDRKYLIMAGYDADVGTAGVSSSASATYNRVIAVIDSANKIDTSTAADFFSGTAIRSATSTDGKSLWACGAAGSVYTTTGNTMAPTALNANNLRVLNIINGQLYVSSSSGATHGINTVGTGIPKTAATVTLLSGFDTQTTTSHYGFVAFDRDAQLGIDTIYVSDDSAAMGGVQRWSLKGGKWQLDGTMATGLTAGTRGLTGYIEGNNVVLLATTIETTPRVVSFVDDGTDPTKLPSKEILKAGANTAFRGIAQAPQ